MAAIGRKPVSRSKLAVAASGRPGKRPVRKIAAAKRTVPKKSAPNTPADNAGSVAEDSAADRRDAATVTDAAKKSRRPPTAAAKPKALVQRVYNTIDVELTKLEEQTGVSSQDRERASRALSQMVNSLEKAIEMQREMIAGAATRNSAKDKEALRHAEDLRREIADRFERLNSSRKSRKRAGGAD